MNDFDGVEILLVEDNPYDAELAMRALKESKLANHIVLLNDGEEALNFIFSRGIYQERKIENVPKLILLDLKLPKVDGLEVLKEIKSNVRTRVIPVVMMTSSSEEKDIIESYQLGVNSYLIKPIDFDKFVVSVKDLGYYWLLLNQSPTLK